VSRSRSRTPRAPARARPARVYASRQLDALVQRFAAFRRQHGRGARVPRDLRDATLSVLEHGAPPRDVYRACGLSWGQVAAWRSRRPELPPAPAEPPDVRVFTLTEDPPDPGAHGAELELRLGRWSICVRLASPNPPGRS